MHRELDFENSYQLISLANSHLVQLKNPSATDYQQASVDKIPNLKWFSARSKAGGSTE